MDSPGLFDQAFNRRKALLAALLSEGTDCYRLFHGVSEGIPGLTIDRYGSLILVQTFREPLTSDELRTIEGFLREKLSHAFELAYNHRGKSATQSFDEWHRPHPGALVEFQCQEFGVRYLIRARHQGIDPWLFLDLRAGRRYLREVALNRSVLNLFSYTCSVGITAAAAGASEVWNVDFATSSLEVGRKNALLNELPEARVRMIEEDCLPVMRQLAGLPVGGRGARGERVTKFARREFDIVFLDPPAWSKGAFGAVDVAGDYSSLFKPAVLATRPDGGRIIATNHVASIELDAWIIGLKRCAEKAGRPIRALQTLAPESDFPSFDGRPPLKIVVCEV
ncbi:class I SAM-dependent methyltransferase [Bdellovibrionota bacterium FG-1]